MFVDTITRSCILTYIKIQLINKAYNQVLYNSRHSMRSSCHRGALHTVQMHKVSDTKGIKLLLIQSLYCGTNLVQMQKVSKSKCWFFFFPFLCLVRTKPFLTSHHHLHFYYCSEELICPSMNTLHFIIQLAIGAGFSNLQS